MRSWSAASRELFGYTARQMLAEHVARFYPDDERAADRPRAELDRAVEAGCCARRGWWVTRDGARVWCAVSLLALRDAAGAHVGFGVAAFAGPPPAPDAETPATTVSPAPSPATDQRAGDAAPPTATAPRAPDVGRKPPSAPEHDVLRRTHEVRESIQSVRRARDQLVRLQSEHVAALASEASAARLVTGTLDTITDAFFAVDSGFRFTYINRRAAQVLGRGTAEGLRGTVLWTQFPEAWDTRFGVEYRRAMEERTPRTFEAYVRLRDRWYEAHVCPALGGLAVYLHDVTERHRAEASLRESEGRFRATFENSMDAALITTPDGRVLMANSAAVDLFGYTASELEMLGHGALVDAGDERMNRALAERRRTGRFRGEVTMTRKDGTRFTAELSSSVFVDAGGVERTSMLIRDVTDRLRAEAAIRSNERLLSALFEVLPVGLSIVDVAGRVVQRNAAAHRIWGDAPPMSVAELAGWRAYRADTGERLAPEAWPVARAVARGERCVETMLRIECADRKVRTFLHSALPLRDDAGRPAGAIAAYEDVSALHETEAALRRTVRAREEILGVVAHDLRNPLNTVALSARAIQRQCGEDAHARAATQRIVRAVARMDRMIQDLLDIARIDAGTLAVRRVRLGPTRLLAELCDSQASSALDAAITLRTDVRGEVPDVAGDHDRLLQVLENLVTNAMKFTPRGGSVTVGAEACEGGVRFWVADTGSGISAEDLPHLFDRFWQADPSDRRGAGLGLAVVRGIVEAHGGSLHAESRVGAGTTISFTVPRAPTRAA